MDFQTAFQTAIRTSFNKYATFTGRAARAEFWYFALFRLIVAIVAGILDNAIFRGASPLGAITSLALLLPSLAVSVRRLHDLDKSGWWVLIGFIPVVGWIVLLIWNVNRGTVGPNQYGEDPLAGSAV
ncbi:MAG TPA: DUF805 domain-containing protein [Chloroflexota bacterium]